MKRLTEKRLSDLSSISDDQFQIGQVIISPKEFTIVKNTHSNNDEIEKQPIL